MEMLELREPIEKQSQEDLSQEAVPPGYEDFMLVKRLTDVCQQQLSRHLEPGKGTAAAFCFPVWESSSGCLGDACDDSADLFA